ncbi:MAG TPA: TIGR03085 family metal-binding protein, partial [Phycicoccus sp.]
MTTDTPATVARAERYDLCDTLLEVGPDAPTLCDPWRARDLAAHLVVRERRPDLAAGLVVPALAGRLERAQAEVAHGDWQSLVRTVRTGPPRWSPTRIDALDGLVNTVEMIVHHEDVLRGDGALGPRREVPDRTARAAFAAVRKSAGMLFRRSPVGVRLVAPGRDPVTA